MMRSMYSAVSGLKTHQTKMDVIGNNIANVNTVAFKSSSVTFRDILYQTTSGASGANVATGVGGVNAKQIGLGVSMAATSVSIETAGASETTGNPFDLKLTDKNTTNFFIVNDGTQNLFTRAGSFYVDGAGNLCMTSTGYTVMGWQVDPTTNEIRKDTVTPLRIMQEKNLTSAPEATTNAVMSGVLDENDSDVKSGSGKVMNLNFYDDLGYQYTAKFAVKTTNTAGEYTVSLTSILDSNNTPQNITGLFADCTLKFNTNDGTFNSINDGANPPGSSVVLALGGATGAGQINANGNFKNITIDFTQCLNYNNSGKSTIGMDSGAVDGTTGKGRKLGNMIGISIDTSGKIFGSYDNGNTELLGQIAVAQFSNASGLEKVGESCYQTTLNSGEFDGIGVDISADGSSMTTGELEMSNVDLSTEFTQMITTQRGFQANSRVITTSDTLLEELVNLKR